jgi:hypothetical protein
MRIFEFKRGEATGESRQLIMKGLMSSTPHMRMQGFDGEV